MNLTTDDADLDDHELLMRLDRLEELREDLLELNLRTLDEVEARIDALNRLLDERDAAGASRG